MQGPETVQMLLSAARESAARALAWARVSAALESSRAGERASGARVQVVRAAPRLAVGVAARAATELAAVQSSLQSLVALQLSAALGTACRRPARQHHRQSNRRHCHNPGLDRRQGPTS
jgi:hypothetical protein